MSVMVRKRLFKGDEQQWIPAADCWVEAAPVTSMVGPVKYFLGVVFKIDLYSVAICGLVTLRV